MRVEDIITYHDWGEEDGYHSHDHKASLFEQGHHQTYS